MGPLCQIIDSRDLYNARFDKNAIVADMIHNNQWIWKDEWKTVFPELNNIQVPTLSDTQDKAMWRCNNDNRNVQSIGYVPDLKQNWEDTICPWPQIIAMLLKVWSAKVLSDIVLDTIRTRLRSLKVKESTNVQKVAKEWDIQFKIQNVMNGSQNLIKDLNA
ncbi:hypothetical protein Tco_0905111 [Tanacetum coccineum]